MLAHTLDPIRIDEDTPYAHLAQSFMLAYYARSHAETTSERSTTSYYRAWGFHTILRYPRVAGGRPSFVVAYTIVGNMKHFFVAIEGMSSFSQIWTLLNGAHSYVPVPGLIGEVHASFKQYADQILAIIAADTNLMQVAEHHRTTITFSGFSMGAAIAEIAAYTWRSTRRTQMVFCHKFGAPRFANPDWVNRRDRGVSHRSIYLGGDPVVNTLSSGWARTSDGFFGMIHGVTFTELDPNAENWTLDGVRDSAPVRFSSRDELETILNSRRPITNTNPWRQHLGDAYRYMISRYASRSADLLHLRVLYLEHPQENNWQRIWRDITPPDFSALAIETPPPADYSELRANQLRETHMGPPIQDHPPVRVQPGTTQRLMQRITLPEETGNRRLRRVDPVGAQPGN